MVLAFNRGKEVLSRATMLVHPCADSTIALTVDASDVAVGAVLQQRLGDIWQPLAFFSKQLRSPERNYSTFDRELLSLYLAIRHFRYYLEGRVFTAFTNHKPLVAAIGKSTDTLTARQQRYLAFISEYTTDIQQVAGKSNIVADCLSRFCANEVSLGIDPVNMAKAQQDCDEVHAHQTSTTGLQLCDVPLSLNGPTLLCDVSTGRSRPIVPTECRHAIFDITADERRQKSFRRSTSGKG